MSVETRTGVEVRLEDLRRAYGGVTALFPALIGDFFGRVAIGAIVGFSIEVALLNWRLGSG